MGLLYLYFYAMGWTTDETGLGFWFKERERLSPSERHSGSGIRRNNYPVDTGSWYPGVKLPRCEAKHSPRSSAKVKEQIASNLQYQTHTHR